MGRVWSGGRRHGASVGQCRSIASRPRVLIGGAAADSVVVTHATEIVGLAPPTESANPTFDADVQIIAADGQLSNVLAGAFRYTTP